MGRAEKTVHGEQRYRAKMERPRINYIPKGLSVDYEEEYSKYLMQEVSFEPRDNDDFTALLRLLGRWHKKSIPQILEKNRPDAAYAICFSEHLTGHPTWLATFMKQVEDGDMEEAAGNAFYLLERLARLYSKDVMLFEPDKDNHCSFYEFLMEAVCHILAVVMKDKRTDRDVRSAMTWQLGSINMLYGRIFESSYTSYQDLMNGDADDDTFAWGYEYLVIGPSAFVTE